MSELYVKEWVHADGARAATKELAGVFEKFAAEFAQEHPTAALASAMDVPGQSEQLLAKLRAAGLSYRPESVSAGFAARPLALVRLRWAEWLVEADAAALVVVDAADSRADVP